MEYDDFVLRVISCVEPLVPEGRNVLRMFCGVEVMTLLGYAPGYSPIVLPSADFARIFGKRAELFSQMGMALADVAGVPQELYECKHSRKTGEAYLDVSCYARNVRRWKDGQLPRKIKARADFCVAATCWAFGWGEVGGSDGLDPDAMLACRTGLLDLAAELLDGQESIPAAEGASPFGFARALWLASMRAYRNSLDARAGS